MKLRKKSKLFQQKFWLFLVIILLIVAPIFINVGLMVTDYYYQKTGNALTAVGLSNENWLEFWKDYISIAIAFFGIYLVWDSSNKDRKKQYNRELAEQYLHTVSQEENVLVEVSQCFNTGIIVRSLLIFGNTTVQESRLVLGQYISEKELDSDDILKGLTNKAFNMDYVAAKECLYTYLRELVQQIKLEILD